MRSGVVNAGSPFDIRVTAISAESTYAGIVRLVTRSRVLAGAVRPHGRPLRLVVPGCHDGRSDLGLGGRGGRAGGGGPRGGHPMPPHPRRTDRLRRGPVARCPTRGGHQGRRSPRAARPLYDRAHRQDRDPDERSPCAVGRRSRCHVPTRTSSFASLDPWIRSPRMSLPTPWCKGPWSTNVSSCCLKTSRRCRGKGIRGSGRRPRGGAGKGGMGRRRRVAGVGEVGSTAGAARRLAHCVRRRRRRARRGARSSTTRSAQMPLGRSGRCVEVGSTGSSW